MSQPTASIGIGEWKYADLKLLDEADAPLPGQDLVAAYLRFLPAITDLFLPFRTRYQDIELRIDFLDIDYSNECDLYVALDYYAGGESGLPDGQITQLAWDSLIVIAASGEILSLDSSGQIDHSLAIRILRDPLLDYVTIKISGKELSASLSSLRMQIFTTSPGQASISDHMPPFHAQDSPPPPANLLFTFWNSYPAYTPALAMRRWDGAHTGPFGGRHGLFNLLRTARNHRIPIALVDLKYPAALSALDYARGLHLVRLMASEGMLILPDVVPVIPPDMVNSLPDSFFTKAANFSRQVALEFGIPGSQFILAASDDDIPSQYVAAFIRQDSQYKQSFTPYRKRSKLILPIPGHPDTIQATTHGLSLAMRKTILHAALTAETIPEIAQIVPMGGSLPESEWGVPQISRSAFLYISKHPWMRVLTEHDLLSLRPGRFSESATLQELSPLDAIDPTLIDIASRLITREDTPLQQLTWHAFFSLFSPVYPSGESIDILRGKYLSQINALLAAGEWESSPEYTSSCNEDIDQDGQDECVLVSHEVLAVIELDTGALTYLFVRKPDGVQQIIAPTSQFSIGLGVPSTWNLDGGLSADPQVVPGALADDRGPYSILIEDGALILNGRGIQKIFQLDADGIRIESHSSQPVMAEIPVALDPLMRFRKEWSDHVSAEYSANRFIWHLSRGHEVWLEGDAQIQVNDFLETRQFMGGQEDPNRDYPAGHFLPFPVAIVTVDSSGSYTITITLKP